MKITKKEFLTSEQGKPKNLYGCVLKTKEYKNPYVPKRTQVNAQFRLLTNKKWGIMIFRPTNIKRQISSRETKMTGGGWN
jgi:hypothetical protein